MKQSNSPAKHGRANQNRGDPGSYSVSGDAKLTRLIREYQGENARAAKKINDLRERLAYHNKEFSSPVTYNIPNKRK